MNVKLYFHIQVERSGETLMCETPGFRREADEKCTFGTTSGPETSVTNYHYTLRNSPEERISQETNLFVFPAQLSRALRMTADVQGHSNNTKGSKQC
jgi:hypothetical protein